MSAEFLQNLFTKQNGKCAYTGHEMTIVRKDAGQNLRDDYATTIDRVDPTRGYTKDNVVLCCLWINVAKNTFPLGVFVTNCKEFLNHISIKNY
jgi:CRISPR/Cas system Type II protein with McrA/HNH and RuvC-like nuclease domain